MNDRDMQRLAHIRMEVAKWGVIDPNSKDWDNAFLLRVIDDLVSEMKLSRKT